MKKKLLDECRLLIADSKIKEAIKIITENFPKLKTNLIHLSSRLSKNKKEYNGGILAFPDYSVENNKITKSLLNIIEEENNLQTETNKEVKELKSKIFKFEQIQTGNELLKLMQSSKAHIINNDEIKNQVEVEIVSELTSIIEDYLELFGVHQLQHKELMEIEIILHQKLEDLQKQKFYVFAKNIPSISNGLNFKVRCSNKSAHKNSKFV